MLRFITAPLIAAFFAVLSGMVLFADANTAHASLSVVVGDVPKQAVNYQLQEIATGFNHPSAITFLPDEQILVAERNGGLTLIHNGSKLAVTGLPDIFARQQAGFHDVVLHPNFANNSWVYFSYSHGSVLGSTTRLSRAQLWVSADKSAATLRHVEVLFSANPISRSPLHYGGRLLFLPDGTLLLTLGEGYIYKEKAQDLDNHFGKIIRINDDGSIPADNPFVNKADAKPEIYTYGHRNPQGLIMASDGRILAHEHGPKGGDEVNEIRAGANYGWPAITYGIDYSGAIISELTQQTGMEQSIVHYIPSIAPSGFTQYQGELFPEWQGDLFIGGLVSLQVRRIELDEQGGFGMQSKLFTELNARIRDVATGPDGALYFVTDAAQGSLYRVIPSAF